MEGWLQGFINYLPGDNLYLLVLLVVAFTEALPIFALVVPGSTLAVFAGFLVIHGKGSLILLMLVHMTGALLGDLFSFWMGHSYGSRLLRLKSFQKRQDWIKTARRFFHEHGGKSIFFARFLGPIRGITPFVAGLSGMPGRAFSGYALISAILWGISYPALGYLGGSSWQQAQSLTTRFGLLILLLLVITILRYVLRRTFK